MAWLYHFNTGFDDKFGFGFGVGFTDNTGFMGITGLFDDGNFFILEFGSLVLLDGDFWNKTLKTNENEKPTN